MSDKIVMACPACREDGSDKSGNHLVVYASGQFGCAVHSGDRLHRRRIAQLMPSLVSGNRMIADWKSKPLIWYRGAKKITKKPLDLLNRIKRDYPACIYDLWESSPVKCDESLNDAHAFLDLFPREAYLWIAKDIYQTGKPEHTLCWRTRAEWQVEKFTAPGTRIAPSAFRQGCINRKSANVVRHLFTVIESDEIGDGEKYADKDEFCSLIQWLRHACDWRLAAVVDSGRRSLHAWFARPSDADMAALAEHAAELGLDNKFLCDCQPWRLPGVAREEATTRQSLLYLDLEAAL